MCFRRPDPVLENLNTYTFLNLFSSTSGITSGLDKSRLSHVVTSERRRPPPA
jgi:hypothetical protein